MTCSNDLDHEEVPQTPLSGRFREFLAQSSREFLDVCMNFVDLKRVFNRVPRGVLWWELGKSGVDEWIVRIIQSMCEDALAPWDWGLVGVLSLLLGLAIIGGRYCHRCCS